MPRFASSQYPVSYLNWQDRVELLNSFRQVQTAHLDMQKRKPEKWSGFFILSGETGFLYDKNAISSEKIFTE